MTDHPSIFISYSHQDEDWKKLVVEHLRVANWQGVFSIWDDRRLSGGENWRKEFDRALRGADIGVLLISRHFLTSNFIMDHEVNVLLERKRQEGLRIYPVLVSDCSWKAVDWLADLNIRPTDGQALTSFSRAMQNSVVTEMVEEIRQLLHAQGGPQPTRSSSRSRPLYLPGFVAKRRSSEIATWAAVASVVIAALGLLWNVFGPNHQNAPDVRAIDGGIAIGGPNSGNIEIHSTSNHDAKRDE